MLPEDYRKIIEHKSQESIDRIDSYTEFDLKIQQKILKFEDTYNFWYGYTVGHLEGYYTGVFEGIMSRPPTIDERQEINEIIETKAKIIREKLARFKK